MKWLFKVYDAQNSKIQALQVSFMALINAKGTTGDSILRNRQVLALERYTLSKVKAMLNIVHKSKNSLNEAFTYFENSLKYVD